MDQQGQDVRLAAEEAFEESLNQLAEQLLSDTAQVDKESAPLKSPLPASNYQDLSLRRSSAAPPPGQVRSLAEMDLEAFAEAAKEIEQFIRTRP